MFHPVKVGKGTRYSYARIKEVMDMPHLLDIQRNSYDWFKREGLAEIFRDVSPISDFTGNLELFFEGFSFGESKYSIEECKRRDGTFAAPVRVKVKLRNKAKGEVKEQEVFFGDFPLMTPTGTFIINGAERVIVSQLVRSPGSYYDRTVDQNSKTLFNATVIPNRGAWIELESDSTNAISVRIDRTRKMPLTYFLRALDFETNDQILELFDVQYFIRSTFDGGELLSKILSTDTDLLQTIFDGSDERDAVTVKFLNSLRNKTKPDADSDADSDAEPNQYPNGTAAMNDEFDDGESFNKVRDYLVDNYQFTFAAAQRVAALARDARFVSILYSDLSANAKNDELAKFFREINIKIEIEPLINIFNFDARFLSLFKAIKRKIVVITDTPIKNFDELIQLYSKLDHKNDAVSNFKYLLEKLFAFDEKNGLTATYLALVDQLDTDKKNSEDTKEKALIGIYTRLRPGEPPSADNAQNMLNALFFDARRYDLAQVGRYKVTKKIGWKRRLLGHTLAEALFDPDTGEELLPADTVITQQMLDAIPVESEAQLFNLKPDKNHGGYLLPIKLRIRSRAGSFTILAAPTLDIKTDRILCRADMTAAISYLFDLYAGIGLKDDIDHLGNRRVRAVGELLQNQFRVGMTRMERVVRERMTTQDAEIVTPQNLINIRPVVAAIKEFFGSSQLSQFMDQHNPLSELTHKRRLSALGPGGLSRERAGFEVRDVHISHYGRMCPIETPEGPNIGLIGSLSNFARVNQFGFIETPYRKVDKAAGKVSSAVTYLTADEEEKFVIAQANEPLDDFDRFKNERVTARVFEQTTKVNRDTVDFMDVSPKQVVSIATALIPFLENDDANRALMGANMQRQAVPLLRTQAPLVGTGMEFKAACDSGVMILAKRPGTVACVDSRSIVINVDPDFVSHQADSTDTYNLIKFTRSNQGTCINQIPIVKRGEHVDFLQPIADGPATAHGELALGFNIIVAYCPWEGYNYEDAILLSENLIKRDIFTSIHIEEYQCDARETKLGPEDITRDIPNVAEDSLANLDQDGIIAIGSDVRPGDILVGKVTPKGETELTAEERLLRAIFGEKAREVRDTSLRVPHGENGKVVAVNIFDRDNNDDMPPGVTKQIRVFIAQKRKISVGDKMSGRHGNKGVVSDIRRQEDMPFLPDGTPVDIVLNPLGVPSRMNIGQVLETHLGMAVRQIGFKLLSGDQATITKLNNLGCQIDSKHLTNNFSIATPVFDGAHDQDISDTIELAGLDADGKSVLFDGRTGEPFDNRVTVGCVYMLKLHHLVDDKIHARSTGPYSLVTQQPLGGKAQFGGQRFGEMEVWALEAYGAAFTLQEILTVKSDDVVGRVKAYEAIVKGQNIPEPGVPESFKVLIKELQAIGLDIRVLSRDSKEIIIKDDDDDDSAVRNKAVDLDIDVGDFADHQPKAIDALPDDSSNSNDER